MGLGITLRVRVRARVRARARARARASRLSAFSSDAAPEKTTLMFLFFNPEHTLG